MMLTSTKILKCHLEILTSPPKARSISRPQPTFLMLLTVNVITQSERIPLTKASNSRIWNIAKLWFFRRGVSQTFRNISARRTTKKSSRIYRRIISFISWDAWTRKRSRSLLWSFFGSLASTWKRLHQTILLTGSRMLKRWRKFTMTST